MLENYRVSSQLVASRVVLSCTESVTRIGLEVSVPLVEDSSSCLQDTTLYSHFEVNQHSGRTCAACYVGQAEFLLGLVFD
jgi:hypothetical protein